MQSVYGAGQELDNTGFDALQAQEIFLFFKMSGLVLGPTQPLIQ
jgi:hypothetical protein